MMVRPAGLLDVWPLWRLFGQALTSEFGYFPVSYRRQVLRQHNLLRLFRAALNPRRILLVARQRGRLVGYIIGAVPSGGRGQVYWFYVSPAARGQGIGEVLLQKLLDRCRQLGAHEVDLATHLEQKYYAKRGFVLHHKEAQFGNVEMAIMQLKLKRRTKD